MSNLYKSAGISLVVDTPRVIDSNALVEALAAEQPSVTKIDGGKRTVPLTADKDGFSQGLSAEILDSLTEASEDGPEAGQTAPDGQEEAAQQGGQILKEAQQQAERLAEEMRQQAQFEIENMKKEAADRLAVEKEKILLETRELGYQDGLEKGKKETEVVKRELEEEGRRLRAQYDSLVEQLEPQFIDTLCGIYEHIFHVELSGYRDIIVHLIADTLRKTDGAKNYIIHVSKEDYPYVSMQKKQLTAGAGASLLEVVEDITLSKNQALIETEGGIFDCSLGTQLEELGKKLRLLSYEKPVGE
ncbi:MAG: hypothetical protein K2G20_07770 [Lachnospiraceae bacterium]|nr:hypothetical protein [Lachnospiraceae bacterium]